MSLRRVDLPKSGVADLSPTLSLAPSLPRPLPRHLFHTLATAHPLSRSPRSSVDYLYQMTNGWLLGRTGYELGSYKNLAVCSNQD